MNDELEARFDALYAIGAGEGANRPGLSRAEEEAHRLVADWMRAAGLDVRRDAAGNTFGRLSGADPALGEVWTGSHLDTVPSGGRFDGALGVLAAVYALERLRDLRPERTVAAVAFRDEEGWRFGRGFFGSRAVCGQVEAVELRARDEDGISVAEALEALDLEGPTPARPPAALPEAFVEAHVEQGPVLERTGSPLGVVTAIAGIAGLRVVFDGSPGHAGTVPLNGRADALVAAAAFVTALRRAALRIGDAVATVGECTVSRPAANVIPSHVEVTVDARAPQSRTLDDLVRAAERLANEAARSEQCRASVVRLFRHDPVPMDSGVRSVLARACRSVGHAPTKLISGAGHDAGILAGAGVPAGLLFVRSGAGGVSHSPAETTDFEAIELCMEALTLTLRDLADARLSRAPRAARVRPSSQPL
ncbi:MAG: Zn-dependent hydrolase [Gaiellaceae bacterium]